jgi:hypothetical protein
MYLENRDNNMLWQPEDDEVLRVTISPNELNFKLILRYKGK